MTPRWAEELLLALSRKEWSGHTQPNMTIGDVQGRQGLVVSVCCPDLGWMRFGIEDGDYAKTPQEVADWIERKCQEEEW